MAPKNKSFERASDLRRQAEVLARETAALDQPQAMTPAEVQRMVHELRVRQIHLEMQNE